MTVTHQRFAGRRIALIGASPGQIGGAIAARLCAEGAELVIGGRNTDAAEEAARAARPDAPPRVHPIDLADSASIREFLSWAADELGGLNGLVNNAASYGAAGEDGDAVQIDEDSLDELMGINVRGHVLACKSAIPHLLAAGGGSIVMTSSIAAIAGEPTRVAHGVSKAGVIALARHVAARWGKQGVRCNTITPGRILSRAVPENEQRFADAFLTVTASPRLGRPDDIAAATAFLMSDDAAFINGQNLAVDGGVTTVYGPAPGDDEDFYPRFPFSKSSLGL